MVGLLPDQGRINELLARSLMLVTALSPKLGYERAATLAQAALAHGTTLREEALRSGWLTAEEYDLWVQPRQMLSPD